MTRSARSGAERTNARCNRQAVSRYREVAGQLGPGEYEAPAEQAFSRMSPSERMQFRQYLRQRAQQQDVSFQDLDMDGQDDRFQDPRTLARVTSPMHEQQPGLMEQLLAGGGGGGGLGGGLMGGLMAGGGSGGGMLGNPLPKAALGGSAAMAVQRMMRGGR